MVAPYLLQVEFRAAARSLERRGLMSRAEGERAISLFRLPPIRYSWDEVWPDRVMDIARSIGASRIYDSLYLACAEANEATLYTCDASFVRACGATSRHLRLVQ